VRHQARPRGIAEPIASYGSDRGEVVLYRAADGTVTVDVRLERDTIWLNLNQMADLFARDKSVISRHLRIVFDDGELERDSAIAFFAATAADGKTYQVEHFNLDAIISVGYRVNSKRGTQFRIWTTAILRDHLLRGYTVNERRLKDDSLRGSLEAVRQTAGGKDVYPSIEEKAAHLLYFLVKNHSFVDGNKRIADNALVAMILLIAESRPADKSLLVNLVVNLVNKRNP
jgi:prophage maintenance system killer protein